MRKRNFLDSLNNAAEGFLYAVKNERNMRIHFLLGFLVLLLGLLLQITKLEWIILSIVITLVLATEMINTAIEETTDLLEDSIHPGVRVIKDVSAGACLVTAVNALIVGYLIFSKYWAWPLDLHDLHIKYAKWNVAFFAVLFTAAFVIFGKAFFAKGTPFRGGVLSGHSATAFALWTAVLFCTDNLFVIGVTFFLAIMVARSRVKSGIHRLAEILAGALVGILVTALFFKLFS